MKSGASTTGQFSITMTPADPELPGTGRFDFTKNWTGDIAGTSRGIMLSAGDPTAGAAGYLALEVFDGTIAGRHGCLVFQQIGTMVGDKASQQYEITPGSGTDELAGITGTLTLDVTDGQHRVMLEHSFG